MTKYANMCDDMIDSIQKFVFSFYNVWIYNKYTY